MLGSILKEGIFHLKKKALTERKTAFVQNDNTLVYIKFFSRKVFYIVQRC